MVNGVRIAIVVLPRSCLADSAWLGAACTLASFEAKLFDQGDVAMGLDQMIEPIIRDRAGSSRGRFSCG